MTRIATCFAQAAGRKLLVPYITAGDPDLDTTLALMHTLVRAGADVIELGVPFSDPMADGPVIQAACERALKHRVTLTQVIDTVKRFRESNQDTAIVLMGYLNPVERLGYARFATLAREAGVDGVLTVDMPPEEAADLVDELRKNDLDSIFLLSPTTPDARLKQVCELATGYIYYVSLKGVTGAANLDTAEVAGKVTHIQSFTDIPVAVGFGIRDARSAAAISQTADAVIVGSALVALIGEHAGNPETMHSTLHDLVNGMRLAMDRSAGAAA
ncbi:MAG: tryptophan synthase subunit alpha [Granulosicoccus sp.]|nr:tryptophan synthase subunit alpha [Granulosicoccus sp.]